MEDVDSQSHKKEKENGRRTDVARIFYSSFIHYVTAQQLVPVLGFLRFWLQYWDC
jgi:hypothetical protein